MVLGLGVSGEISAFKTTANTRLEDLETFKREGHERLGKLEKFKEGEFSTWKNESDKRLRDLEDFKRQIWNNWSTDHVKNENRLDDLELQMKGLKDKTHSTDKKVAVLVKKQDTCGAEVKTAFADVNKQLKKIEKALAHTTRGVRGEFEGGAGNAQMNNHSPGSCNLRFDHNRVLINGSSGAMLLAPNTYPASSFWTPYPTPPPSPPPSNTLHVHHHHGSSHRRRRHSTYYRENGEEDGAYQMQQLPGIHLGFTRTTPRGCFRRGKRESYEFSLGGGTAAMGSGSNRGSVNHAHF